MNGRPGTSFNSRVRYPAYGGSHTPGGIPGLTTGPSQPPNSSIAERTPTRPTFPPPGDTPWYEVARALTTLITAEAELDCYRKLRTSLQTIVKERKSDEEARAKANNRLETVHKQFEAKRVEREETMKKLTTLFHTATYRAHSQPAPATADTDISALTTQLETLSTTVEALQKTVNSQREEIDRLTSQPGSSRPSTSTIDPRGARVNAFNYETTGRLSPLDTASASPLGPSSGPPATTLEQLQADFAKQRSDLDGYQLRRRHEVKEIRSTLATIEDKLVTMEDKLVRGMMTPAGTAASATVEPTTGSGDWSTAVSDVKWQVERLRKKLDIEVATNDGTRQTVTELTTWRDIVQPKLPYLRRRVHQLGNELRESRGEVALDNESTYDDEDMSDSGDDADSAVEVGADDEGVDVTMTED